jgi:TRAP-type C4-dicarboxylate transport system permease large subunit
MLIVYAATTNVSIGRLYAGAMLPGLLLAGLYIVYVVGRATLNPSLAPKPREEDIEDISALESAIMLATSFLPLAILIFSVLGAILLGLATPAEAASVGALGGLVLAISYRLAGIRDGTVIPEWAERRASSFDGWFYALGLAGAATLGLMLGYLVLRGLAEGLFGIALPAEPGFLIRPASGALITAALSLALLGRGRGLPGLHWLQIQNERLRPPAIFAGQGLVLGAAIGLAYLAGFGGLGLGHFFSDSQFNPYGFEIALYSGLIGFFAWRVIDKERLQESVYLTARTSAMVCWLFVGSWTFASVFSYLGGHELIKDFVVGLDLSPIMFLILAQLIIFFLGWPLEWSEIIIIFVPIFLPMLPLFGVDPLFFGILVALNLQTSFLTPPMAMAAYYLKGVAPPQVQLIEIFKGVMPFLSMVLIAMVILYLFPQLALWLPTVFYGR